MEGIGSRTGRPSSRYGSAPVFTGPVRRWHKQWVNVSSSSSSITYNHNNNNNNINNGCNSSASNNNNNNNSDVSCIRIRRWTPVSSGQSSGDTQAVVEERPKRKIRYAPIVVLDGKKKEPEKGDVDVKEASKPNKSPAQETTENDDNEKKNFDNALAAKPQASQKNEEATNDLNNQPMDLDADGDNDDDDDNDDEDHDLGGDNKVADWVKAAQRGFAP